MKLEDSKNTEACDLCKCERAQLPKWVLFAIYERFFLSFGMTLTKMFNFKAVNNQKQ